MNVKLIKYILHVEPIKNDVYHNFNIKYISTCIYYTHTVKDLAPGKVGSRLMRQFFSIDNFMLKNLISIINL